MSLTSYPLISDWITANNARLLIHSGKVDIGQRISTALSQIAHEELTIPFDRIDIPPVRTGAAPNEGITSGSNSIETSGHALRCAAATLRALLVARVITRFGGTVESWQLTDGILRLPGTNHRVDLLQQMTEIPGNACIDPQAAQLPRTKGAMPQPAMLGLRKIVEGRFEFIQDTERRGMLHARIIRPPHARARLGSLDPIVVEKMRAQGLLIIRDGSFLALAGPNEWPVVKAMTQLAAACRWDNTDGFPETDVFSHLNAENAQRFLVVDSSPTKAPIPDAIRQPDKKVRFERPYQMHGSLAPSAALAEWDGKALTLHSQSQGIYPLRSSIADSLGLKESQVDITHVPGSGCYGHTGADDAAFEAALIAMELPDRPILLKWTREDEHAWEPYASAMAVDLAARMNCGKITAFSAEVFSDSHRGRPRPGANRAGPSRLLANHWRAEPIGPNPADPNMRRHAGMHRNLDPVYEIGEKRLVKNLVSGLPHRTSAMRCLGGAANIFAIESFMDELALGENIAPVAFRRSHLSDPRAIAVLDRLDRQILSRPPLPDGQGRGIAYAQYKNQMTRVAVCVEVDVTEQAEVHLLHVNIVADAGRVIDSAGLAAQLEGGFIQAASWALYEQISWDRNGITSRDWESYPVIRFANIPDIDVTILDQPTFKSVGAGEASPGPSLAAIANAIFDATGLRLRRLPFTPQSILQEATTT